MSRLAGKFAGILLVDVPEGAVPALTEALVSLQSQGLRVIVETSSGEPPPAPTVSLRLQLVGQDRPGIVRDISRALAKRSINVEELSTGRSSAPMSAELLFHAEARLQVPAAVELDELREALEALANDLMVDLTLSEAGE
jgi:glycine cleavage system regulatory protein